MAEFHITFEPVAKRHYQLLRHWLNQPHWREWWGDPETELQCIIDMAEGRDSTKPYIFHVNGTPTGYIQVWFIGPHQTEEWSKENPWLMELPSNAVGVDLSIGEEDQFSRGIGSAALRSFVDMLRAQGHTEIIIDPDPENSRAVRAYTKAGFSPVPRLATISKDALIMQHKSSRNDTMEVLDAE